MAAKRILVTGPKGFVGARIMDALSGAVASPSLRDADEERIKRLMDKVQPDLIIHTAAMSDIGSCERDPEGSYRANVALPVLLVFMVGIASDRHLMGRYANTRLWNVFTWFTIISVTVLTIVMFVLQALGW